MFRDPVCGMPLAEKEIEFKANVRGRTYARARFFEFPRKINMLELSRRIGVALSTLSEITRRGIRRLLEDHFET